MASDTIMRPTGEQDGAPSAWHWPVGHQPGHAPRAVTWRPRPRSLDPGAITLGWFHRYPGRFGAEVAVTVIAEALARARRPVRRILDPFAGTGTVGAVSLQLGIDAIGMEIGKLGLTVAQLRTRPPADLDDAAATLVRLARLPPRPDHTLSPELVDWLGEPNAERAAVWLNTIAELDEGPVKAYLTVAVSQALRPASHWLIGSVKPTRDPQRTPPPIDRILLRTGRRITVDCAAEQAALRFRGPVRLSHATHLLADARRLPLPDHSVDAIVTSPPYLTTCDYFGAHRLSYLAFGWPQSREKQLGERYGHTPAREPLNLPGAVLPRWYEQYGHESTAQGRAVRAYADGLFSHFEEARRVLAPGGSATYAVANSIRSGRVFALASVVAELMQMVGFEKIRVWPRAQGGRRILPAGRDQLTGRIARGPASAGVREYIVSGVAP